MIGVVAPATQLAVAGSRTGRIGLLATPATVASGAYERAVARRRPHVHLESVACPDLAPIIQGGFPFDAAGRRHRARRTARRCARPRSTPSSSGCTHYPLVAPMLQRTLGRGVTLVTSGAGRRAERRARAGCPRAAQPAAAARAATASSAPATSSRSGRSARASCRCRSARSCTSSLPSGRDGVRRPSQSAATAGRRDAAASGLDRAGVRAHRDRLGADLDGGDARDLHRLGAGERATLAGRIGPRLGHGRVRNAAGLDRRAQAARHQQGPAWTAAPSRSSG